MISQTHKKTSSNLFLIVTDGWAINFYFQLKDVMQIYLSGAQAGQNSISLFKEDCVCVSKVLELLPLTARVALLLLKFQT